MNKRTLMYNQLSSFMGEINDSHSKCKEQIVYFNKEFKDFFEEYKNPSSARKKGIYDHMKGVHFILTSSFDKIESRIPYILLMCTILSNCLSKKAIQHKNDAKRLNSVEEQRRFVAISTAELNSMRDAIADAKTKVGSTLLFCEANV